MMKTNLNIAVNSSGKKVDEVLLFRIMAQEFNNWGKWCRCTYVEEIHQKLYVNYTSRFSPVNPKKVELGDLWIFTFDTARKELRMCIMQTKYRSRRYFRFLDLDINVYQWELLKEKPDVCGCSRYVPRNILNFEKGYESITAYGVFYHDNISKNRDIDFLYTLPKFLGPKYPLSPPLNKKDHPFEYMCPKGLGSPNWLCREGFLTHETISTCSMDVFEQQVLSGRIGVPLGGSGTDTILPWILGLLDSMRGGADDGSVIDTILEGFPRVSDPYMNSQNYIEEIPRALIVVTNSDRYNEESTARPLSL